MIYIHVCEEFILLHVLLDNLPLNTVSVCYDTHDKSLTFFQSSVLVVFTVLTPILCMYIYNTWSSKTYFDSVDGHYTTHVPNCQIKPRALQDYTPFENTRLHSYRQRNTIIMLKDTLPLPAMCLPITDVIFSNFIEINPFTKRILIHYLYHKN